MTVPQYRVGEYDAECELCWKLKNKFGVLIDPQSKPWRICADCINTLWHGNQAMVLDEQAEEELLKKVIQRILGRSN